MQNCALENCWIDHICLPIKAFKDVFRIWGLALRFYSQTCEYLALITFFDFS